MSIEKRMDAYRSVLLDWSIEEQIGHGSGGKTAIYRIKREKHGFTEHDVLKIVNIIEEDLGLEEMSEEYREDYIQREQNAVKKALDEVKLMRTLDNCNNIVAYQWYDFVTTHEPTNTATDLLIRMHEYADLSSISKRNTFNIKEVVKIGIDICTALEGCLQNKVIHRDIKPGNIFFDQKKYLLGDFGISKYLDEGIHLQTNRGTPTFAAPEQLDPRITHGEYDHRVDIYSLGLTMYVLLNNGKLPFAEGYAASSLSVAKRMGGQELPNIRYIPDKLNDILKKACAFETGKRFQTATKMKNELLKFRMELNSMQGSEKEKSYFSDHEEGELSYLTELSEETIEWTEDDLYEPDMETSPLIEENYHEKALGYMRLGQKDDAWKCFQNLAERDGFNGMYYDVAKFYTDTTIKSQCVQDAIYWYEKCIEYCEDSWIISLAEFQLGEIYSKGMGIKKNHKLAEKYYQNSAMKGNMYAKRKFVAGKYVR